MSDTPKCDHDANDKDTAIHCDGLCPYCLQRDLAAANAEREEYRKALRVAAGMLSTYDPFTGNHPSDVLEHIMIAARKEGA